MHIADVTHFLKPDTAMDAEAALRGTTVYLVQVGGRGEGGHYGVLIQCTWCRWAGGGGRHTHGTKGAGALLFTYAWCLLSAASPCSPSLLSPSSLLSHCAQRRLDMLPKPLTEDICSLRCGGAGLVLGNRGVHSQAGSGGGG